MHLELKREVYKVIAAGFPRKASAKTQAEHFWNSYVDWGVAHPDKRHATAQLPVSDKITEQINAQIAEASAGCYDVLEQRLASGSLRDSPPTFVTAILTSLAETTMEFMTKDPAQAQAFRRAGFDAFWRATGK